MLPSVNQIQTVPVCEPEQDLDETALSALFEKARRQESPSAVELQCTTNCSDWLIELAGHSAAPSADEAFQRTYTLADLDYEFFGLEPAVELPSFEQLLQTASYRILEARLSAQSARADLSAENKRSPGVGFEKLRNLDTALLEARGADVVQNVWNRIVQRKDAASMLAAMRRRLRFR